MVNRSKLVKHLGFWGQNSGFQRQILVYFWCFRSKFYSFKVKKVQISVKRSKLVKKTQGNINFDYFKRNEKFHSANLSHQELASLKKKNWLCRHLASWYLCLRRDWVVSVDFGQIWLASESWSCNWQSCFHRHWPNFQGNRSDTGELNTDRPTLFKNMRNWMESFQ